MQIIERGCALLGYAPIGHLAFVVLATRVRPAATLPGGHMVRLVAESRWLQVPLQVWAAPQLQAQAQNCLRVRSFMTAAASHHAALSSQRMGLCTAMQHCTLLLYCVASQGFMMSVLLPVTIAMYLDRHAQSTAGFLHSVITLKQLSCHASGTW